MAKYNGSGILLYADGVEIAAQKGFTLNANVNLFDITTKQSSGWAEHDKGVRSADISFDCLQSTTGLSDTELFAYITGRASLILMITGLANPILMIVDCSNMTINATTEEATGLSGSFKSKGNIFNLSTPSLLTTWNGTAVSYDAFNVIGMRVTYAMHDGTGGIKSHMASSVDVTLGAVFRLVLSLVVPNPGHQKPTVRLRDGAGVTVSQVVLLTDGLNVVDLVGTTLSNDCYLEFSNDNTTEWLTTTNVYLFEL